MVWSKIKKSIISLSKKDIFWILVLILLSLPVFYQLLKPGYFFMQDDLQAFRIHQMHECVQDMQIPCRWVPDAGYQYGYPQFNYYPPFVYYVGEAFYLLGFQFIDAVKILFVLGYIFSTVAMYYLVKEITGRWPAFVSAVLYTYIPYKAVEVYVRGAMSEFWALVFFPLIFLFIYKVIKNGKNKYVVFLSLSIAGLLTTHMLSAMILLLSAGVWTLTWLYLEKWRNTKKVIASGLLGLGLSAFYVLPVILERKYAHMETLLMGYFDWRKHFVGLYRLLISREWGYGSSGFPDEKLNLSTGLIQWTFAIFAGFIAAYKYKKEKRLSLIILALLGVELVTLFLIHPRSNFIWEKVIALQWLQFPWRFLAVSIFLLPLIAGFALGLLKKRSSFIIGTIIVIAAILLNTGFYSPKEWYSITDTEKFSGVSWEKQLTISIFDYLPIYAELPPIEEAPDIPEVLEGEVHFVDYSKNSSSQWGKIIVEEEAVIRVPLFDFPGMQVSSNGEIVEHVNDDCRGQEFCLGLITFNLEKGDHDIHISLEDTRVRKLANIITIVSVLAVGYLFYKSKDERKNKKS